MIMLYKILLILFLNAGLYFSQVNDDSILLNINQKIIESDSIKNINYLTGISDLKDSISSLKKVVTENKDSNNLFTSIILGILTGIIASILTLTGHNFIIEYKLKKTFKYLEGKYEHLVNNEIKQKSITHIKYHKGAKLVLETKTKYGNWNCRIRMDQDVINIGGGAFHYQGKDEGGFMHILVRDENSIYIFPFTLTHNEQKVGFYILKKVIS